MNEGDIGECNRREASEWIIALQERPDDAALRHEFLTWRRSSANDTAWRDLDRVTDLIRHAGSGGARSSRRDLRWRGGWKLAAPVAVAACAVALLIGGDLLPPIGADIMTGTGEVRHMRLADGSRIALAPHSAVAMADGSPRTVRLLRGTAFFDVKHDDAHPFRVVAGEAVATDLGTAFEVRRDGAAMQVAVRDGLVRTSCASGWRDHHALRPGETQQLDCTTGTHPRARLAPSVVASWTDGRLVVTDRPLGEVIAALRPWHRGVLVARGAGMTRRVTGVYDLRAPRRALAALRRAHGLTAINVTPWVTILTAN